MFSRSDVKKSNSRKITYALMALVGIACITFGFMGTVTIDDDYNSGPLLNHLSGRREFFAKQALIMDRLQK